MEYTKYRLGSNVLPYDYDVVGHDLRQDSSQGNRASSPHNIKRALRWIDCLMIVGRYYKKNCLATSRLVAKVTSTKSLLEVGTPAGGFVLPLSYEKAMLRGNLTYLRVVR